MAELIRRAAVEESMRHRGHCRRQVELPNSYMAMHRYNADGEGSDLHSHVETQVGYVLDGEMAMLFEQEPVRISAGQSYVIPTGMQHGGKSAGRESIVINLHVKRHLVTASRESARFDTWTAESPAIVTCGVRQGLFRPAPGDIMMPLPTATAAKTFDIVMDGALGSLARGDFQRQDGSASPAADRAGTAVFRTEILAPEPLPASGSTASK